MLVASAAVAWPGAAPAQNHATPAVCGGIGVKVTRMTPAFADSLGMTQAYGAIFGRPVPGSAAANAGIQSGDVVTTINGAPLAKASDFAPSISPLAPGTTAYLDTWRNGQLIARAVIIGSTKCPIGRATVPPSPTSRR